MKHVYIHIPFCESICPYCAFPKMLYDENSVTTYLSSLKKEITKKYKGEEIDTIYIGGGTPSCLNIQELETLFAIINTFKKSTTCEITMECSVLTSLDKLKLLYKEGVNRLSFGVQSSLLKNLLFLSIKHTKEDTVNIIRLAKDVGFKNINIDLMYAMNDETLFDLKEDLVFYGNLDVNHISTYSLMIEEHTNFYINKVKPIDEELDFLMYQEICSYFKKIGYEHYEISNFAKPLYESKHNLCYWENEEYYGFGLGASSYCNGVRITNTKSLKNYNLGKTLLLSEPLSKQDMMSYEMILGLRLLKGVNKERFFKKYNIKIEDAFSCQDLISQKLLSDDSENLYIKEENLYISNQIMCNFVGSEKNE